MRTDCGESKKGNGCALEYFEKNAYFHGKLITARDMIAEQKVNEDKLYMINRLTLGNGIVCGLEVEDEEYEVDESGKLTVKINPGMALDCCGRILVVKGNGGAITKDVTRFENGGGTSSSTTYPGKMYLYLKYKECLKEAVPISGSGDACEEKCCYNRVLEVFDVVYKDAATLPEMEVPDKKIFPSKAEVVVHEGTAQDGNTSTITLASGASDADDAYKGMLIEITGGTGSDQVRTITDYNGSTKVATVDSVWDTVPDGTSEHVIARKDAMLRIAQDYYDEQLKDGCKKCKEHIVFLGVLKKSDNKWTVNKNETKDYLSVVYNNKMLYDILANHVTRFGNPHEVTAKQVGAIVSVEGLKNPGGNINLEKQNDITINTETPPGEDPIIKIGESHSTKKDNPHEVTAEQAGAPVSVDGVSNPGGDIDLIPDNAIEINANDGNNTITIGETHSAKKDNPHEVTAGQAGAIVSVDGVSNPGGDVDLVAGSNITISPDEETKKITISSDGDGHSLDAADGDPMDVVYVDNKGNVGISTLTPGARLSINGGLHVGGDSDPGDKNLLVDGDCDISGNINIGGDLTVSGKTTTVDAETLEVKDNIIRVNKYKKQKTPKVINGGLEVFRGGTAKNAQIIWDEKADRWKIGVEKTLADILYGPDLTVDNSGNLGIGTKVPSEKLEVNGVVKAASFVGDGSGLTGIQSSISNKIPVIGVLGRDVNTNEISISEYSEIRIDELANGLRVLFDIDIDQERVISNRTCFLTLELPVSSLMQPEWPFFLMQPGWDSSRYINGYIPNILPADLTAENNVISWHSKDAVLDLQSILFRRIRVHLTVKGRSVSMTGDQQYTDFEISFWVVPIYILLAKWGSRGDGDGQFNYPQGVAVDGSGNVYVVDRNNGRIQKFDAKGKFLAKWGSRGNGDGQFNPPQDVAVDGSGNVYVVDLVNHRIQKFDSIGNFILKWGSYGSEDGQFNYPQSVAVDGSGNVYVVDRNSGRIQKFDAKGKFLAKWGSYGNKDGQFNSPQGVAVDGSGNVYVVEYNGRIQKFDAKGKFLAKWGSRGNGDGQFNSPWGVAVDGSGNVYVVDSNNHRIQKFDSNGEFLTKCGSYGNRGGQFNSPQGVAVDGSGNVYVVDSNNHRIQKFKLSPLPQESGTSYDGSSDHDFTGIGGDLL